MTKEELFQELYAKIGAGEVSKEEVVSKLGLSAVPVAASAEAKPKNELHFSMNKMLYVLGAAIVIIGIIIFISQIWDDMGALGHVSVTLGMGLLLAIIGSVLLASKPEEKLGAVFHTIGGLLIPGGAMVLLNELHIDMVDMWPVTWTIGAIFVLYVMLSAIQKNAVLTFFAIANGTAFIYLFVQSVVKGYFFQHDDLYAYLTMVIGISYFLLAYSFRQGKNKPLLSVLHFFGSLGFFGAAFSRVFDSPMWQALYFLLVIGGLFLAAYLKSRAVLLISTIFLIVHVSYITGEYFADSIGWPISLIVLGFLFIGLGYVSITINKKYIKEAS